MPECQLSRAIKALGLLRILQDAPCIPSTSPRSSANFPLLPAATTPFSLFSFFLLFSTESFHRFVPIISKPLRFQIFLKKQHSLSLSLSTQIKRQKLTHECRSQLFTMNSRIRERLSKLLSDETSPFKLRITNRPGARRITISLANVGNV